MCDIHWSNNWSHIILFGPLTGHVTDGPITVMTKSAAKFGINLDKIWKFDNFGYFSLYDFFNAVFYIQQRETCKIWFKG